MKYASKIVLLTFDVEGPPHREDFMNSEVLEALYRVLKLLKKHGLKGLFFITGSAAKSLSNHPKTLELLQTHEIGYHSTSHSVRPAIFEYTDIERYEEAVKISYQRETSEINLFTGASEGEGGVFALRQVFPDKEINAFRAPFFCWSPPHLEALRTLGFRFDFSSDVGKVPVFFNGVTFMPYPIVIDSLLNNLHVLGKKMTSEKFIVSLMHPSHTVFKLGEPSYLEYNNSFRPVRIEKRNEFETELRFLELESFLSCLCLLQRRGLIELQDPLSEWTDTLNSDKVNIKTIYERSVFAAQRLFGYEPKFILSHFYHFFEGKA